MTGSFEAPGTPAVSVIVPASNEAALIGGCLEALCISHWQSDAPVEVIVIANGCRDDTAERARAKTPAFAQRGWSLRVIERQDGGKLAALDAGDAAARGATRVYLDADVTVAPELLGELHEALSCPEPRYASGTVNITAQSAVSRAYARIWRQVPFMARCVPDHTRSLSFAASSASREAFCIFTTMV